MGSPFAGGNWPTGKGTVPLSQVHHHWLLIPGPGQHHTNLELTPLQDRRSARLAYLPAMPSHDFLTPNHSKRHIKPKTFENCVSTNIVIKSATVNTSVINQSSVKVYFMKTHFSLKPLLIGTTLKTVLCAQRQLEASKQPSSTGTNFHPSLSHCAYTEGSCSVYIQIQIKQWQDSF